jgi:uncharacterized protein (TIGR01777 family)
MKVAVTGSTGLIGTALCRSLEQDGHDVVQIVRHPIGANDPVVTWNPATGEIDAAALAAAGPDAVVHLAGAGIGDRRWNEHRKRVVRESRTVGTALLASTLAKLDRRPGVLLSGSAIGYYGDGGDEVFDESGRRGDLFISELCEAWEAAAGPAIDAGIPTSFLRTGIVLDGQGGAMSRFLPLFRLGLGGRLGSGRQWMSWIAIDDEVRAIRFLLERAASGEPVPGPVNLVAPEPVTNAEFTAALGRAVHRPTLFPVPSFGPKLLLGEQGGYEIALAGQRVEPAALTKAGFEFSYPNLDDALAHVLA